MNDRQFVFNQDPQEFRVVFQMTLEYAKNKNNCYLNEDHAAKIKHVGT